VNIGTTDGTQAMNESPHRAWSHGSNATPRWRPLADLIALMVVTQPALCCWRSFHQCSV